MTTENKEIMSVFFRVFGVIIVFAIVFLVIFLIAKVFKKFLFEANDRTKGNSPPSGTSRNDYTYNYDNFTQKQKKDEKPPWEE